MVRSFSSASTLRLAIAVICAVLGIGLRLSHLALPAPVAIEYAAQAMALHASLKTAEGESPTPGFLASARDVRLHAPRLDTAPGPLTVVARRLAGDERQAMYRFVLHDATGRPLVEGRVTVVLNSPLPQPVRS